MNHDKLVGTVDKMMAGNKGILAADESNRSANKRFAAVGVEPSQEKRRRYRQVLFTTPKAEEHINGVILYDETFWQNHDNGQPLREVLASKGIIPGIKVDKGLADLPGFPEEQITEGLDGLPERMEKYAQNGAKFAKWRAVFKIGEGLPTDECINASSYLLSRYARICQENDIVPMVEPEVLFDGNHSIEECEDTMRYMFGVLFQTLYAYRVDIEGIILKTSMVLPGKQHQQYIDANAVAERTSRVLREQVPYDTGGVVFLSGGQTPQQAMIHLNKIEQRGPYPWGLTFSYSRALQEPVLRHWAHDMNDTNGAQMLFLQQLQYAVAAREGKLDESTLGSDKSFSEGQD